MANEVIVFSKKWFEHLQDEKWRDLKLYFYSAAWAGTEFWRNQFTWDLTFSRIYSNRSVKPAPYVADVIKHLMAIGIGATPGFTPAIDERLAPIWGLQAAYIDDYKLKPYAPIIMQPSLIQLAKSSYPVYYSMQHHTAAELSQKSSQRTSTINDMYAIHSLLKKCLEDIRKNYLKVESTPLYELAHHVEYVFFHSSSQLFKGMRSSDKIPVEDPVFSEACKHFAAKEISKNSPFFNGCIRISWRK